jgi:hypothetical protein
MFDATDGSSPLQGSTFRVEGHFYTQAVGLGFGSSPRWG